MSRWWWSADWSGCDRGTTSDGAIRGRSWRPRSTMPGDDMTDLSGVGRRLAGVADNPTSLLLHGIGELVTNDPAAGPGLLGVVRDAALVVQDGLIRWVGPAASAPPADADVDLG